MRCAPNTWVVGEDTNSCIATQKASCIAGNVIEIGVCGSVSSLKQ